MAKAKSAVASTNGTNRIAGHMAANEKAEALKITRPKMRRLKIRIVGTSPYMQLRFSEKSMHTMAAKMEAGQQSNSKKNRPPRNFDEDYEQAFHRFSDGKPGIPAAAFRAACVSACRTVGYKMTVAKLSIFFESDGLDKIDGTPLIRIHGEPEKTVMPVRNANGGTDLRVRPLWREWHADIVVRFDEDQFSAQDAINLITRVGCQVGIGEGRADSRQSCGLGYGFFDIQEG